MDRPATDTSILIFYWCLVILMGINQWYLRRDHREIKEQNVQIIQMLEEGHESQLVENTNLYSKTKTRLEKGAD